MRNTPNTRTGFAAKRHKALQSNQSQTGIISFSHGWPQGGSRRNHSLLHRMEGRGGEERLENDRVFQNSKAGILQARCLSHLSDAPHHEPPGSAGVPPASRAPETGTRRRDAGTPGYLCPVQWFKVRKGFRRMLTLAPSTRISKWERCWMVEQASSLPYLANHVGKNLRQLLGGNRQARCLSHYRRQMPASEFGFNGIE